MALGRRILLFIDAKTLLLPGLTLLAAIGPLFTFLRLWQVKEWRIDRLREHLQAEGWLPNLFGRLRPILAIALLCWNTVAFVGLRSAAGEVGALSAGIVAMISAIVGTLAFLLLSLLQLLSGRQPLPVWTAKAAAICTVTLALNILVFVSLVRWLPFFYPALVVLQPVLVLFAWTLLWPLDWVLKRSVMMKAKEVRASLGNLTVIAVCGSVGKTTTKELLANALQSVFPIVTPAYVNSELGVAQWFLREHANGHVRPGSTLVVEMGGYRVGEVAYLCSVMQPTIGIVTSVGTQHIALYGSLQHILAAEREMPASLPKHGLLILNGDVPECRALASAAACLTVTVGMQEDNDLCARNVQLTEDGLSLEADDRTLTVPLHGIHNVTNVLAAFAAAKAVGLDSGDIAGTLGLPLSTSHTFHVSRQHGVLLLDDTHNSSPQSVAAAIAWAGSRPERPRTLLTTSLIEQGPQEATAMETFGRQAKDVFDRVIFVSERGKAAFERGFGKPTERPGAGQSSLPTGSLLAAVGRVPLSVVSSLLP